MYVCRFGLVPCVSPRWDPSSHHEGCIWTEWPNTWTEGLLHTCHQYQFFRMWFQLNDACCYWCKNWNAMPTSFCRWSRMRCEHQINANAIALSVPSRQHSPLGIYLCCAFNSRKMNSRIAHGSNSSNSQMCRICLICCRWGLRETFSENYTAARRKGMNVVWWAWLDSNQISP